MARHTKTNGDENLLNRQQLHSAEVLAQNEAYQSDMEAEQKRLFGEDSEEFVKGDIGFPPYWKPNIAKGWRGIILARDIRNPKFQRFQIENTGPAFDCWTGPARDGVLVTVETGQVFSISAWRALPLDKYFGLEVVVIATGKREGMAPNEESDGQPRDMWEWSLWTKKENQRLLASQTKEDLQFLVAQQREARRKMLVSMASMNPENQLLQKAAKEAQKAA